MRAFHLLKENLTDVIALNILGDFILFLGKVFVVVISGFVCLELVSVSKIDMKIFQFTFSIFFFQRNEAIEYPRFAIFLGIVLSFLIVHCFMTVFEMSVDTIFICFCVDCEQNDGNTRPYFMSSGLMKVMQEFKQETGGEFNFGGGQLNESIPMMPNYAAGGAAMPNYGVGGSEMMPPNYAVGDVEKSMMPNYGAPMPAMPNYGIIGSEMPNYAAGNNAMPMMPNYVAGGSEMPIMQNYTMNPQTQNFAPSGMPGQSYGTITSIPPTYQ